MNPIASPARRELLRSVALITAALPAALRARPVPPMPLPMTPAPVPQAMRRIRTLLQVSPVAGFQYHEGERVWHHLRAGDALALSREPRNPFDARAVRLDWEGRKLGYVPAMANTAISQLLDRDQSLDAVITRLRESPDPWNRVEFAVYLTVT